MSPFVCPTVRLHSIYAVLTLRNLDPTVYMQSKSYRIYAVYNCTPQSSIKFIIYYYKNIMYIISYIFCISNCSYALKNNIVNPSLTLNKLIFLALRKDLPICKTVRTKRGRKLFCGLQKHSSRYHYHLLQTEIW